MSLVYPIYNDDPIFGNKLITTSCPSKSDICGNLPGISVLSNTTTPKCNDSSFEFSLNPDESPNGCCVVESSNDTCKKYTPHSTTTTANDYDIGIQFLDADGTNPRKICHSAPIRKRVIKIQDFLIIILLSALLILTCAIFGSCYEFWLKYGTEEPSTNGCSFEYINKCGQKISAIDYAFPSSIKQFPYKACGEGEDLEFPYSIINNFNVTDNDKDKILYKCLQLYGLPIKSFCLNFLYTLLFSRKFISAILKKLSQSYKGLSSIFRNIIFLFLTGILFSVVAKYTGIKQLNGGPGFILYLLSMVVVFAMIFTTFATNFILYWSPAYYNKISSTKEDTTPILSEDYSLFHNIFYEIKTKPTTDNTSDNDDQYEVKKTVLSRVGNEFNSIKGYSIMKNVLLFFLAIIPFLLCIVTGLIGSMLGTLYMILSLVFNIFYTPLSKPSCFLSIVKDHGDLLTLLLCISIVISSVDSFNSTTSGTIAGLVGLLILYKIYKNS